MFSHFVKLTPKLFWYVTVTEHKPKDIHAVKKVHQPPAWFRFSFLPNKIVLTDATKKVKRTNVCIKWFFNIFCLLLSQTQKLNVIAQNLLLFLFGK
jgi:hypothetical protein